MADGHSQLQSQARELGGGWYYDEAGQLQRRRAVLDVVAEHSYGGAYLTEPFTRLTKGRTWAEGGVFIANMAGHLADGEIVSFTDHSEDYRLRLVPMDAVSARCHARVQGAA